MTEVEREKVKNLHRWYLYYRRLYEAEMIRQYGKRKATDIIQTLNLLDPMSDTGCTRVPVPYVDGFSNLEEFEEVYSVPKERKNEG